MLRQALLNLAINACQAMPNGGTLRIDCAARRRGARVDVEDTGVGIPPENLPYLRPVLHDQGEGQRHFSSMSVSREGKCSRGGEGEGVAGGVGGEV